jgi:uncharacterized protein (TIGR00299 family) protein
MTWSQSQTSASLFKWLGNPNKLENLKITTQNNHTQTSVLRESDGNPRPQVYCPHSPFLLSTFIRMILKLEAFAGLSGDMFLGLLADLGDFHDELQQLPQLLHLEEELKIIYSQKNKNGIACTHVKIIDLKQNERHGHHHHRHLKDVYKIIEDSELDTASKERAKAIFADIGQAESEVHGVSIEKIHFHEVGAIDSIADVIGAAWMIEMLGIEKTYCTAVHTGYGFVNTEHGKLPVPAPATQKLLQGIPCMAGDVKSEMVTPTGAAILKSLQPDFHIPVLTENKVGYGPGEKDFEIPNVLRGSLCENPQKNDEQLYILQCNLDDCSGEALGQEFQQMIMDAGAVDISIHPILMKKGRPANMISIMAKEVYLDTLTKLLLEMTSTIGVRYFPVQRKELKRMPITLASPWGDIRAKQVILPSGKTRIKPESDDIMSIAKEKGLNPQHIKQEIRQNQEGN